jgi:hypothetical protein
MYTLLLVAATLLARSSPAAGVTAENVQHKEHLRELAVRYRRCRIRLKTEDRHAPDLWNWDGELHAVMTELGESLADGSFNTSAVVRFLGDPDRIVHGGKWHSAIRVPDGETHLVYWWRGGHDYLYFVVRRGRVRAARWWYAGE